MKFSLEELRKALKAELRVMEAGQFTVPASQPSRQQNTRQTTTMFNGVTESKQPFRFPCAFCGADHPVTQCSITSIEERWKIVKEKRLCFKCLSSKHQKRDCQSRTACRLCKKQHHSSLHDNAKATASSSTVPVVTGAHFQVKSVPQNVVMHQYLCIHSLHSLFSLCILNSHYASFSQYYYVLNPWTSSNPWIL